MRNMCVLLLVGVSNCREEGATYGIASESSTQ